MRVVVDTNVLVSAALKDKSLPGMAVHVVEQCGVLLKPIFGATNRHCPE
jgi:predicted nucleic acid-binding protein